MDHAPDTEAGWQSSDDDLIGGLTKAEDVSVTLVLTVLMVLAVLTGGDSGDWRD
jgi:hypothetical protein